jgi:hypothetical protein
MTITEYYPLFTLASTLLLLVLIAGMGALAWQFNLRSARLPQATLMEDLTQRNKALLGHISDKQAELAVIQRQIQDRDRVAAEVAALAQQHEALHLEIAAMADTERQIDELKRQTADVALQHAEAKQLLEATLAARDAAHAEFETTQGKLAALPQHHDELRQAIDQLREDKLRVEDEVAGLRSEKGLLLAAREEAVSLAVRKASTEDNLARITAERHRQTEISVSLQAELARMQEQERMLQADIAGLQTIRAEVQDLAIQRPLLMHDIEQLSDKKQKLDGLLEELGEEAADAQDERAELQAKLAGLRLMSEQTEGLAARKAALEIAIKGLEAQNGGAGAVGATGDEDLRSLPLCLRVGGTRPPPPQEEAAAIEEVRRSLSRHGLKYNARTIDAFHTSLKINDNAQLTVLAGVSGTGKSLLPRRYAEAMGIDFLPIAVEPRWDSPQDLLGFYNYVEKRYRGTELARALVHMDPQNTSGLSERPYGNRMLLVLLDEMNLARVEYYFSEFLSRLEIRPRWTADINGAARRQASMPLDTRGKNGSTVYLFPSHNVLFVGTMNDDESTQALSDKVLDRGNVMQFPAPNTFERPPTRPPEGQEAAGHRDYGSWRNWIRPAVVEDLVASQKIQQVINDLAAIMQRCGRPFGHRLNEAMMAYVANYPRGNGGKLRFEEALADQIELRILPKLRGVVIDDGHSRDALEDAVSLIRNDLHDSGFADQLHGMLEGGMSQFNWRGMDRSKM